VNKKAVANIWQINAVAQLIKGVQGGIVGLPGFEEG
jgi:hypothetical protein